MCLGCVSVVSRLCLGCVLVVSWCCLGVVLVVSWLCLGCVLVVSWVCLTVREEDEEAADDCHRLEHKLNVGLLSVDERVAERPYLKRE